MKNRNIAVALVSLMWILLRDRNVKYFVLSKRGLSDSFVFFMPCSKKSIHERVRKCFVMNEEISLF
jgi:hypothetical protein